MVLVSCPGDTSLESLTNWLLKVDCANILPVMCLEKDTYLFNTPKCPIEKDIAESTDCDSLRMF